MNYKHRRVDHDECDVGRLGYILKCRRREHKLTIDQLADMSGVSRSNIHNLETASIKQPNVVVGAIAHVLDLRLGHLLGDYLP